METQTDLFQLDLIKGYPYFHWQGKHAFTGTSYYPAQLKEVYGKDTDEWMNKIFWGDNLQVMSHLLKKYRNSVDLIYIDPPFDSKADYKRKIELRGNKVESDISTFEEKQYGDIWTNDDYLQFMYERIVLCHALLSDTGSLYLHCDWRKVHHLRMILDEVFGANNFQANIAWRAMTSSGYKGKSSIGRSHADILYYTKSSKFTYNPVYLPMSDEMLSRYSHEDPNGRKFKDSNLGNVTQKTINELENKNLIYWTSNGTPRIKHYLDEAQGVIADDIWTDINTTNSQSNLQTGYPTQKPEALLERILKISSNPGDLVFDCFMGSGTTQAVAMKLGRRFLGADINLGSIQTTTKRLLGIAKEIEQEQGGLGFDETNKKYTGFEVYNVNDYDFFRNELEAKKLIIEALGMQAFPENDLWDAELDGRMVAILGINRIATASEFKHILANIDISTWEEKQKNNPTQPVEHITFVCMGHDPSLKAQFESEVEKLGFKVDLEIIDLLKDKADLRFKREADAEVEIKEGKLHIKQFYPMNLLQKLSFEKTDVKDWKELVDSVMIDWNYDEVTFSPEVTDIPEKNELVKGIYEIPKTAGKIRVKITDLISESWEKTIN